MIHSLRNRHFYTWILLAFVLPIGLFMALKALPETYFGDTISHERPSELSLTELSEDDFVKVSGLEDPQNSGLEITLNRALTVPAALVYLASAADTIDSEEILGKLDSQNTYYFRVGTGNIRGKYLLFYDPVNKVIFHKVAL